ncbi:MAG: hypothetical protein MUE94_13750 [Verrucomicrobia bacterium]|nr:hypothetical protein [Verrucomicrobiota bacterium]
MVLLLFAVQTETEGLTTDYTDCADKKGSQFSPIRVIRVIRGYFLLFAVQTETERV